MILTNAPKYQGQTCPFCRNLLTTLHVRLTVRVTHTKVGRANTQTTPRYTYANRDPSNAQ
jgi:hypothetical protein